VTSPAVGRLFGPVRREPALFVLTAIAAALFCAYAVVRHQHLFSGTDLATFDQAVWNYSRFHIGPATVVGGELPSLLGQHFHPLLAVLAPLYWVWSDPVMLLVAQAVLVAAAAVPVFYFACPRVGRAGAYAIAAAYLAFWGVHAGVAYDFHEVAFAPLLIATAILMIDRERWRAFLIAAALLLLVKEDMATVVVALGLYAATRGHFRPALIAIAAGIAWFFISTRLLIPAFANGRPFTFWSYGDFGPNLPSAAGHVVLHPLQALKSLFSPYPKADTLAALFVPFLLLPLGSPLIIVGLPLVLERMFSSDATYWYPLLHYSLAIAPVIAMAAADGAGRISRRLAPRHAMRLATALSVAALVTTAALGASQAFQPVPGASLSPLARPSALGDGANEATRSAFRRAVAAIPADASVTASPNSLPHVSERRRVYLVTSAPPSTEYVLQLGGDSGGRDPRLGEALPPLPAAWRAAYAVVSDAEGVRLLKRRSVP
jgi:uncharacterized membrane protein